MAKELQYSSEKNIQILLALLKANGIKRIIASPGATNFSLVGSVQNDPYFEVWSAVDERSAAYMACGMAAETGEPVVLSCTGSTASRNYVPGLTEAYYRKLPVLAVTSHQGTDRIGHLLPQNIDRRVLPNDVARLSVELPVVRDERDEAFALIEANRAILELRRGGGGPVHINIFTTYSRDFSVKALPAVRAIRRYQAWDELPQLPARVAVFVGCHVRFSPAQVEAIEQFCASRDCYVACDHTSGYHGRYRVEPTLAAMQTGASTPIPELDVVIHIGEVSAAAGAGTVPAKAREVWRVSPDGELRDPFKKLTAVFEMQEEHFFRHYTVRGAKPSTAMADHLRQALDQVRQSVPELPFGNIWASGQLARRLPQGSVLHLSASNTRRCWNMHHLPQGVTSTSNVGCCGIDGATSAMLGASVASPEKLFFLSTGDLAFFYDLNALGSRHVGPNVRIMLINNGLGAEFRLYTHPCSTFSAEANPYMAAAGHFGNKNPQLVRHFAQDLGFRYLSATGKEEFLAVVEEFAAPKIGDRPILLEVFTRPEDESEGLRQMTHLQTNATGLLRSTAMDAVRSVAGEDGLKKVKNALKGTILGRKLR